MVPPTSWSQARPPLAMRVGVTGSRRIADEMLAPLQAKAASILRLVRDETLKLAAEAAAGTVYVQDSAGVTQAQLRLVSPLAEGADRLVAEQALNLDYRLHAPFPFTQCEYEKDFGGETEAFRKLAVQAQILELDGGRNADETASYEAVGQFVVRNSDLVIALWDGKPARGRGGTAEIVRYAARSGLPVWWINVEDGATRLALTLAQIKHPVGALEGARAEAALVGYLRRIALPAAAPRPNKQGAMGHAAHMLGGLFGGRASPLTTYLEERPIPKRGVWRAHRRLLALLAPNPDAPASARLAPAVTPAERWWEAHYTRADALSQFYGDRCRSSYVLITALAFATFAASLPFEAGLGAVIAVALELILLLCVGGLVLQNCLRGWRERWIAYRLLAELCCNQLALAPLGRTLPGSEVRRSAEAEAAGERDVAIAPREAWVNWYFLALQRGAPMPEGESATANRRAFVLARSLVAKQKARHRIGRRRNAKADRRLLASGEILFLLVVLTVVVQLALLSGGARFANVRWIELLIRLFSAAAAALVGLRAYAEFALSARQSSRMEEMMEEMEIKLDALDLDEPLASRRLGATLRRLTILTMLEASG